MKRRLLETSLVGLKGVAENDKEGPEGNAKGS